MGADERRAAVHPRHEGLSAGDVVPPVMSTTIATDGPVSSNGKHPTPTPPNTADAIGILRRPARNLHLAGGFGPLVAGAMLFLLMLWAAPSVAPEHIVRPAATAKATPSTTTTCRPRRR